MIDSVRLLPNRHGIALRVHRDAAAKRPAVGVIDPLRDPPSVAAATAQATGARRSLVVAASDHRDAAKQTYRDQRN